MKISLKPIDRQVVVITGASSGIGLATARAAARAGARPFLVARDGSVLADAVAEIERNGGEAGYAIADVGDAAEVRAAADAAIARFGRIDSWVSNAGVAIYAPLLDTPDDAHDAMFRTNYFGLVHSAKAAIPHLVGGGAFVVVGSIASDIPSPELGAYAASKHAVKAYAMALRMELGAAGRPVSVTLVKPSGIDTPIGQHAFHPGEGKAMIPPPTYAPELVAEAILDACVRPRREITVGGAGRAQALFAEHFPGVFERLAPIAAKSYVDKSERQPRASSLHAPHRDGRERSGDVTPKQFSLYTSAMLHPKTSAAMALGFVAGAAGLLALRRRAG